MNKEKQRTEGKRQNAQHAASHMQHAVELHIEQLVLHGFAPGGHHRIKGAVETELTHLFAEQGMPPSLAQDREVAYLDGGPFKVAPGSGADAMGVQVAHGLYKGMDR